MPPRDSQGNYPTLVVVVVLLSMLVCAVYGQAGRCGFISFDDGEYVYQNHVVLQGLTWKGISWALTTFHAGNWHPLTWISHMIDVALFGSDPAGHHWMNMLFHLFNVNLLFFVFWRMTGKLWRSVFLAALFGVHPLHVESVAWVSERKDVLSAFIFLLTLAAYTRYVRQPGSWRYLLTLALFALGLMAKPMLVTLPFVLLLLDIWPLERLSFADSPIRPFSSSTLHRLVREKIPMLALSILSCGITYLAQSRGSAVRDFEQFPFAQRLANALVSYAAYLYETLVPASLAIFYPHPASIHASIPAWKIIGSVLVLGGISWIVLRYRRHRPYLAVGWLWYLGTLVPVIGLVQVGAHAHADRYAYIPLTGIFIMVVWGVADAIGKRLLLRIVAGTSGMVVLVTFAVVARNQVEYWRDNVALFSRANAVTDDNWLALNNLGVALAENRRFPEAAAHYREALKIRPDYAGAWCNLGVAYAEQGQLQQAIQYYREALRFRPDFSIAWNNLGVACDRTGQSRQAIEYFRRATELKPDYTDAWYGMGLAHARLGQHSEAIASFRSALRINPKHVQSLNNLGHSLAELGQLQTAIGYYLQALQIQPNYSNAWNNMGMAYEKLGQVQEAIACYRKAQQGR